MDSKAVILKKVMQGDRFRELRDLVFALSHSLGITPLWTPLICRSYHVANERLRNQQGTDPTELGLRAKARDWEDVDTQLPVVAGILPRPHDDREELRLGIASRRVGRDLARQAVERSRGGTRLVLAELHLEGSPPAVAQLDDSVDLEPVGVTVVVQRVSRRAGKG